MKKRVFAILLAFSFLLGCMSPVTASAAAKKYRLTKVTGIYTVTDNSGTESVKIHINWKYSSENRSVSWKLYHDGTNHKSYLSENGTIRYNAAGQVVRSALNGDSSDENYVYTRTYLSDGRLAKQAYYFNGKMQETRLLEYNTDKKLIGETVSDEYGSKTKLTLEREADGRLVITDAVSSVPEYSKDGTLTGYREVVENDSKNAYVTFQYDAKGRCTQIISYEADGTMEFQYSWQYNSKGKLLSSGNNGSVCKYQYDAHGNVKKETITANDEDGTVTAVLYYHYATVKTAFAPELGGEMEDIIRKSMDNYWVGQARSFCEE